MNNKMKTTKLKEIEKNNKKQRGLWFTVGGKKFFVKSPFAIALLDYLRIK